MATLALTVPEYLIAREIDLHKHGFVNIAGLTASVSLRDEIVSFVIPDAGFFRGKKFCVVQDLTRMIVFVEETGRVWLSEKILPPGVEPEDDLRLGEMFDAACIGPQVYKPYLKGRVNFEICKSVLETPFAFGFEFDPDDIKARKENPAMRIVPTANMEYGKAFSYLLNLLRKTYKEMLQAVIDTDTSAELRRLPNRAFNEAFRYEPMRGDTSLANNPLAHYTWVLIVSIRDLTLPDISRRDFLALITA